MKRLIILLIFLPKLFLSWGQKPELVIQTSHSRMINAIVFSPDGQYVLSCSHDGTAKLWDLEGHELQTFSGHTRYVNSAAFSPDGQYVLTGGDINDSSARLWDLEGRQLQTFPETSLSPNFVAFSADGQQVYTGADGKVKVWDLEGRELRSFMTGYFQSMVFSPDGRYVLTVNLDGEIKMWDLEGRKLQTFMVDVVYVKNLLSPPMAFSRDSRYILAVSGRRQVKMWDVDGQEVRTFSGEPSRVNSVAFSPDGQSVLIGDSGMSMLWDVDGHRLQHFSGHTGNISSVAFSPDGQYVLTGNLDGEIKMWDVDGQEVRTFSGAISDVSSVAFSPDGQYILTGKMDKTANLWNLEGSGPKIFYGPNSLMRSVTFSPDGQYVLTDDIRSASLWDLEGNELQVFSCDGTSIDGAVFSSDGQQILAAGDKKICLWDLDGQLLQDLDLPDGPNWSDNTGVALSPDGQSILIGGRLLNWEGLELQTFGRRDKSAVAFSPDGQFVLTAHLSRDFTGKLWDLEGRKLQTFAGHSSFVMDLTFSPDGQYVLTGSYDGTAKLWDLQGQELQTLSGHTRGLSSVAFSSDGRYLLTGSGDGTAKLWDRSGQLLLTLYNFSSDRGWVVSTPDGRFDGDEAGLRNLHYVVGLEVIELDRLKERYYEPGLMGKIMGFNKEPLRDITAFDQVALYPEIKLDRRGDQLTVNLNPRSGGIGRTALYINDSEKVIDLNPDRSAQFTIKLSDYQHFYYTDQPNTIGIKSYNEEGWLASSLHTITYEYDPPGTAVLQLNAEPHIYALCIGTADYASGTTLDLAYAEQDVLRMAQAIQLGGRALLNDPGIVEVVTLSTCLNRDCPDPQRPTKKNIRAAIDAIAEKSKPEDVFLLYLSGHGKVYQDYFYYLTQDMGSDYLGDDVIRERYAISSAEFAEWLNAVPARKQVMMVDACASGQFNEDLALLSMKNIPGSQIRALDRLRDRTGIFIISGSANDQASYEASPYGMGLLTYSLLTGMSGGALREDEYMDVERLFSFAEEQVPVLAEDVGAIQTPKYWKPEGSKSFDIGRATQAVKEQIQLPSPKPVFTRVNFQDEFFGDELKLEATLNALLRDLAFAKGEDKALLFVDADSHPNAYRLRGKYTVEGAMVRVEYFVYKGEERVGERMVVEMEKADIEGVGKAVIRRAYGVVKD